MDCWNLGVIPAFLWKLDVDWNRKIGNIPGFWEGFELRAVGAVVYPDNPRQSGSSVRGFFGKFSGGNFELGSSLCFSSLDLYLLVGIGVKRGMSTGRKIHGLSGIPKKREFFPEESLDSLDSFSRHGGFFQDRVKRLRAN